MRAERQEVSTKTTTTMMITMRRLANFKALRWTPAKGYNVVVAVAGS